MEGSSTAYFQSDQFLAVDAGLPDLFNQIGVLVLFQAVCSFIPCFSKQMVSSTRHAVWLLVFQNTRSGQRLVWVMFVGRGGGGEDVWLVAV